MSILDAIKEAEALAEQTRKDAAKQAREIIGKAEEEVLADREARLSALREKGAALIEEAKIEENAAAVRAVAEAGLKDDAMVKEAEKRFDDALALILERTKHA